MGAGRSRWLSGVLASLVVAGCYSQPPMEVEGNLSVRGGDLGDWELDPGVCLTGEPIGFVGVDLSSHEGDRCVRFMDDPFEGPVVIAYIPGTTDGREFLPRDCNEFDITIERTKDQYGAIYNVGGSMTLDCATEAGAIVGELVFDGCW